MKPLTQRDIDIHTAKVLLTEAMKRRAGGRMHATLLQWAANARRRAAAASTEPKQRELFVQTS